MSYEENKTNASNIEIIPCERINCKGAAPCVLNINSYMNVCEFEDKIMKYMCNMRPVMDEFICVNLNVIADRPVDFIQSIDPSTSSKVWLKDIFAMMAYISRKTIVLSMAKWIKRAIIISMFLKHQMERATMIWQSLSSLWCALKKKLLQTGTGKR